MKKIIVIMISVMLSLLLMPSISGENTLNDPPDLTITMEGGFIPRFEICNEGDTSITDITFTLTIDSSLVFLGGTTQTTIGDLLPGECITIGAMIIFGFGPFTITIEISYDDVTISQTFRVFMLGFFVIPLA